MGEDQARSLDFAAYPVVLTEGNSRLAHIAGPETFCRVEKMKFGGKGKDMD